MILEVKDIHTFYATSHILFGVPIHVDEGEVVGLLGKNGAGKTTTLRSIMGIPTPSSGSIKFRGQEIVGKPPDYIARLGIGFIPDDRRIFPELTVRDNLEIARKRGQGGEEWTVDRVYDLFPSLREFTDRLGLNLSGGEQQMLAIGRALMGNPSLLLMDEPTQGLSPLLVKTLSEQVGILRDNGLSILLCEQNLKVTLGLSRRIYIMETGRIQWEGTPEELQANKEIEKKYLLI